MIEGDPEALSRAFHNLLDNAVKYSPGEHDIQVGVERSGGQVNISVEDHGIGIPAGERAAIFTKFKRGDQARRQGIRGTGRESIVPAWLDHLGIPYTGSDPLTFAVTLDKAMAKTIARAHGIPTPAWRCVFDESELDGLRLTFPLFVKPNGEGSSMGIRRSSLVGDEGELRQRVRWVLQQYRQGCLVEEYMPGREFCVGILGNRELEILPIVEVRTSAGFYSYESKSVHDKELICPAQVPGRLADDMREMGRTSFREFRCRDLARLDVKLDAHGAPGFLEMNPLPGLSPYYSIFNVQARAAGIEFEELIRRIIANALERSGPSSKGAGK